MKAFFFEGYWRFLCVQRQEELNEGLMSELLYLKDAYIRQFEAMVEDQFEGGLILDQTAFYPGGGGQPCDLGALVSADRSWQVTKVKRVSGKVVHFVDALAPDQGLLLEGSLDWQRRYQLMRTHTALHILCGVVWRDYKSSVTGGNMEPLKGRMDFEFETMHQQLVAEIEEAVNREVDAARDVVVRTLPRDEAFEIPDLIRTKINLLPPGIKQVRTVEIVGLDLQADGGTHVNNTAEVGRIKVVDYKSKGKINKRIYIELEDAWLDA
jgi:misacylated tRNA(Ala) deacylase